MYLRITYETEELNSFLISFPSCIPLAPDYDLLYSHSPPADALSKAYQYYQTWYDAPVGVKALLHAAAIAPVIALAMKLNAWTESALFFDGSSLGRFIESPLVSQER
jgi:hypothetical protein